MKKFISLERVDIFELFKHQYTWNFKNCNAKFYRVISFLNTGDIYKFISRESRFD